MQAVTEKKMRDPRTEKLKEHRKCYKTRIGKERTEIRKAHFRSFRRKSAAYCKAAIKYDIEEIEEIAEPIFKKTSGRITW